MKAYGIKAVRNILGHNYYASAESIGVFGDITIQENEVILLPQRYALSLVMTGFFQEVAFENIEDLMQTEENLSAESEAPPQEPKNPKKQKDLFVKEEQNAPE